MTRIEGVACIVMRLLGRFLLDFEDYSFAVLFSVVGTGSNYAQIVLTKGLLPIRSIPPPLVLAGLPVEGATTELVLPGKLGFLRDLNPQANRCYSNSFQECIR